MTGASPLGDLRVVESPGFGPGPFAAISPMATQVAAARSLMFPGLHRSRCGQDLPVSASMVKLSPPRWRRR